MDKFKSECPIQENDEKFITHRKFYVTTSKGTKILGPYDSRKDAQDEIPRGCKATVKEYEENHSQYRRIINKHPKR
jgi:hypothetical protein